MKYWFSCRCMQIAIGAIIGVILGFILGENAVYCTDSDAFLQFLKMLIIPLVINNFVKHLKMNDKIFR